VSLKIPYKRFPLHGGGFSASATLNVNIALPTKNSPRTKRFEAVIDSGASRCIFHASIGRFIGLELEKGVQENTLGIAGSTNIYLYEISLHVPGGIVDVIAGFCEDLPIAGLLGMNGFFDHFKVTFDPTAQRCEIERLFLA
jgi:hypothetical protein